LNVVGLAPEEGEFSAVLVFTLLDEDDAGALFTAVVEDEPDPPPATAVDCSLLLLLVTADVDSGGAILLTSPPPPPGAMADVSLDACVVDGEGVIPNVPGFPIFTCSVLQSDTSS